MGGLPYWFFRNIGGFLKRLINGDLCEYKKVFN